ncbi:MULTISPECIES: FAD-dependent oxidoreductase [unclassified Pseudonocardia]|uniref:FAD-dependent oxidoreductase n=1 Tax=unclassified Pseudonocardia TaxID=2619320 RepID=UPI00094ABAA1|nr:FAD-dependent oxidoreductase [Pseudonocardia sp. Ae707_Ps1]OLM17085.1 Ferredoxin / Ferredoxin--NADP(+) reductase, actinobacterial (eukaryote-like) type [Pseudonocardia sp. Ae707_Ps1]
MAFAITQTCCTDASCVAACPVNCIHPTPDEPDYTTTDMLYIDPRACIDCGACADACPVDAVFPVERLSASLAGYADVNAAYYDGKPVAGKLEGDSPLFHDWYPLQFTRSLPADMAPLDVAVVGTGPAGMYAAQDLLLHTASRVTLVDRLDTPGGLVRYGVAPDHPSTKRIGESFARFHTHPRVRMRLGTEIGRDVTADELAAQHDAVVWAVGAPVAKDLGIEGEGLPGSIAADTVVGWYNGHPDVPRDAVDTTCERVVVIGTGNVSIDVARILTAPPEDLDDTPIDAAALAALRAGAVREVVVLGRRGPETVAATAPELRELLGRSGVDVVVDEHDARVTESMDGPAASEAHQLLQGARREKIDWSLPAPAPRVVFRFHSAPDRIAGDVRARGVHKCDGTEIPAGLVVRAAGHRGRPVPGLPFDDDRGVVPNDAGRVADRPGHYVVGWIKRGPSGGIGTNRTCAAETVGSLLDDAVAGRLPSRPPRGSRLRAVGRLLRRG